MTPPTPRPHQAHGRRQAAGVLRRLAAAVLLAAVAVNAAPAPAAEESYSFDLSAYEKRPFTWSGYLEGSYATLAPDRDAALYRLRFRDEADREHLATSSLALVLEGRYDFDGVSLNARVRAAGAHDTAAGSSGDTVTEEAYLALQPAPSLRLDAGKRVVGWGKGYAWNPVAFVDRAKDPTDPELTREGYVMLRGEGLRSFTGTVQNAALTVVALPVHDGLNEDFGPADPAGRETNVAAKLYLLIADTDVDLVALGEGTRSARYGLDFSRNLASHFEVHGEWAHITEVVQPVVTETGAVQTRERDADVWLLGLRYLTESELTVIAEAYANGAGYTAGELEAYYRLVARGYERLATAGDDTLLERAERLREGAFGRPNAGRRYGYLRLQQKDAFDVLYLAPGLALLRNLDDGSMSTTPELTYTGVTNLELRLRVSVLSGDRYTEFGEKLHDWRADLRARWYF